MLVADAGDVVDGAVARLAIAQDNLTVRLELADELGRVALLVPDGNRLGVECGERPERVAVVLRPGVRDHADPGLRASHGSRPRTTPSAGLRAAARTSSPPGRALRPDRSHRSRGRRPCRPARR